MRVIKKEINKKNNIVLTCQDSVLLGLFKQQVKFITTEEYSCGYWNWRKLPDKTLIDDELSSKLDILCRNSK